MAPIGRNEPCPCGSGRKYKRCCAMRAATTQAVRAKAFLGLLLLAAAIGVAVTLQVRQASDVPGRVWSSEHGHWHDVGGGRPAGPVPAPGPPGPAPPDKVWSYEHGHWHDVR